LCEGDEQCDDGDPCTTDGCVNGICAYDRVTERPQRAVRFATRGVAEDVQFSGSLSDDSLQLTVAEGEDGVEVFDLSNPTVPKRYLQIATAGPARAVRRGNNRILVAEHEAGLEIFDSGNGGSMGPPLVVEASGGPASVHGFSQIHRGHVVLFLYRAGMAIMNINAMTYGDICDTRGRAVHGLNFPGENVSLAADSLAGLAVCSWAEGTSYATQTERLDTAGRMMALSRRQDLMMVAEGGAGFGVIDVSSPLMPVRRYDSGPLEGEVTDIHMTGTATVAVAAQDAGVLVFAMEDCFEPVLWYQWPTDGPATSVDEVDGVLAVGLGEAGVDLVDMGCRPPAE
jgi:hypothetical protein